KVFRRKAVNWIKEPRGHPDVNQRGVEAFKIRGPLLGLPLLFQGEALGALVLWGNGAPPPLLTDAAAIEPYAALAAIKIALGRANETGDAATCLDVVNV